MTTTVRVSILGNREVRVKTENADKIIRPGAFADFLIHGDEVIAVQEFGAFISNPENTQGLLVRNFIEENKE